MHVLQHCQSETLKNSKHWALLKFEKMTLVNGILKQLKQTNLINLEKEK